MKVAYCDCCTPRCSRSSERVNPSKRRLPPPRTTGATMIVSSSTRLPSSAWRMTSAPPMTCTSLPPADSFARSIASGTPATNVKAPPGGSSSGRCVTMKNGRPHGFSSPQCPAASYVQRPPTTAPTRSTASASQAASSPVGSLLVVGDDGLNDTRCAACGSLLFSVVREGEWVHVALGSLVDAPTLPPAKHIFVGSKAPWFEITDDLPQFEEHATKALVEPSLGKVSAISLFVEDL